MRRACLILCTLPLVGIAADLKTLFDNKQWFELRDAVESTDAPPFYRGVVACVFDDVRRAESYFGQSPKSLEAHGLLASAHMRAGNHRQTLAHLQAMQAIQPEFQGLRGALALFRALSCQPQPAIGRRGASEVRMTDDLFIPLSVDGKPAKYGFDSGMDLSIMSETEARRLGLGVHDVAGSELHDGASGKTVGIRFTVVARLALGGFELRNVVFLVVRNDALPFSEQPPDKQGLIGFHGTGTIASVRVFDPMRRDARPTCASRSEVCP